MTFLTQKHNQRRSDEPAGGRRSRGVFFERVFSIYGFFSFSGLFDDFDVNSNKLGATVAKRNEKLAKLLDGVADMNLGDVKHHDIDAFGDAYEYLIEIVIQFSSSISYRNIEGQKTTHNFKKKPTPFYRDISIAKRPVHLQVFPHFSTATFLSPKRN